MLADIYTTLVNLNPTSDHIFILPLLVWLASGIFYFTYVRYSDILLFCGLKIYRGITGMRVNYIDRKCGQGQWCYAEKGYKHSHHHAHHNKHHHAKHKKYPTLVFLHGFGGDKDTWPSMIRFIPKKYHCVIVDLPGHGETTFVPEVDELNLEGFMKSLKEFLEITHLDREPIFLIGCSLGGAIAGLYASTYPDSVAKLGLLCPAVKTPIMTKTCEKLLKGDFDILIPKNGKQFISMIKLLANKRQPYPERIMQSWVNLNFTKERQVNLRKLLESIVIDEFENFESNFPKIQSITAKTIVIWGENDEMLHVSGAKLIHDNIKNSTLKIIKDCNHVIQLDQPYEATKYLLDFLNS